MKAEQPAAVGHVKCSVCADWSPTIELILAEARLEVIGDIWQRLGETEISAAYYRVPLGRLEEEARAEVERLTKETS